MMGRLPDIELVVPGIFTLSRELSAAAASSITNCGQACVCQCLAPIDSATRLATATIPIMTLALMGKFVMVISVWFWSVGLVVPRIAVAKCRHRSNAYRSSTPDHAKASQRSRTPNHAGAAPNHGVGL